MLNSKVVCDSCTPRYWFGAVDLTMVTDDVEEFGRGAVIPPKPIVFIYA